MTPQEKQQAFYEALGRAISQWAGVEMMLFEVFCELTKIPDREVASAVFFSSFSFRNKLTMADAAAQSILKQKSDSLANKWAKLKKQAETESKTRNDLAHYMAIVLVGDDSISEPYRLRPNLFNFKQGVAFEAGKKPEYTTEKIVIASQSFGRFSMKLHAFAFLLRGERAPWHDSVYPPDSSSDSQNP